MLMVSRGTIEVMNLAKNKQGFTIVELLIVVVVIAILASITIAAYSGVLNRAKQAAAQASVSQAAKKIQLYAFENSYAYPADLQAADVSDSGQATYQYTVNNLASPKTFCVTATVQNFSYYQSDTQQNPAAGACSGHGSNGLPPNLAVNPSFEIDTTAFTTRTNLSTNPSFETNTTGWGAVNGGTGASVSTSTVRAHSGSRSILYTYGDSVTQDSGPGSGFAASAGAVYTVSAWVYAPASVSTGLRMIVYGSALGTTERGATSTTTGSWVRLSYTVTTPSAGTLSFAVGKVGSTTDTGKQLHVDSISVEASPAPNSYFSGASSPAGDFTYIWTGAEHLSTSTERALTTANYPTNGSGAARFRSAERSVSGSFSARVMITTNALNPGLYQNMSLAPGTYTFISKVWGEPGISGTPSLTAQGTGVALNTVSGYSSGTSTQGQWVELRRLVTISATTNVNFFVYMPGTSTSVGSSFWVDDFAVVLGTCTDAVCY